MKTTNNNLNIKNKITTEITFQIIISSIIMKINNPNSKINNMEINNNLEINNNKEINNMEINNNKEINNNSEINKEINNNLEINKETINKGDRLPEWIKDIKINNSNNKTPL